MLRCWVWKAACLIDISVSDSTVPRPYAIPDQELHLSYYPSVKLEEEEDELRTRTELNTYRNADFRTLLPSANEPAKFRAWDLLLF